MQYRNSFVIGILVTVKYVSLWFLSSSSLLILDNFSHTYYIAFCTFLEKFLFRHFDILKFNFIYIFIIDCNFNIFINRLCFLESCWFREHLTRQYREFSYMFAYSCKLFSLFLTPCLSMAILLPLIKQHWYIIIHESS